MKRWATRVAIVLAALAGTLGMAGNAHALTGGPWRWHNTATLVCLDSNPYGDVYAIPCNAGPYQLWNHTEDRFGDMIRNHATNRCLDTNPFGDVYTLPCNGGMFQHWIVTHKGIYGWEMWNVGTGLCLDSNPYNQVFTLGCNGGNFQRWH